jgi:hypothetical protein
MLKFCKDFFLFLVFFLTLVNAVHAQSGVKGNVVDRRGKPVSFLTVAIVQHSDTLRTLTSENGRFQLECNPGNAELLIFNDEATIARFLVISTAELLDIGTIKLNYTNIEVVIKDGSEENGMDPLEHIDIQKLATGSGGVEQFLKYTQAANSNNELTSNYNVRGGNYDENLVYVNGFLVNRPFLTRSGQQEGMSFINTALVDNIYFSAGGFQSIYGDKLSSVLDIKYKTASTFHASAMASLLGVETHVEDALGKADRFRYLLGARYRANGYLLNSLPTKGNYNPVFWDVQLATEYDINEHWKWKVLAHTASNEYQFAPQTQKTDFGTSNEAYSFNIYFDGQEDTRFITSTVGTAFTYESKRFEANTYFTAFHSNEQERFDIQGQYYINELETDPSKEEYGDSIAVVGVGTFMNHARNKLNATIFSAYHQATYHFKTPENSGLKNDLNWGFGIQFDDFSDRLSEWRMIDSAGYSIPQGSSNDLELFEVIKGNLSLQNQRTHAYVQQHIEWKKIKTNIPLHHVAYLKDSLGMVIDSVQHDTVIARSIGKWQLDIGVRALYTTYNNEFLVMPRASLVYNPIRYVFHNGRFMRRAMKLKIATGCYHQPPFYREFRTFNGTLNPEVRAQKSFHFVVGGDYSFFMWQRPKPFKFGVEAYYKYLWDINPYEIENVRIRYYAANIATGYATGMDLTLNGEFVPGLLSFFKVGLLSTKENIIGDSYTNYYNAAGEKIVYGISDDQIAVDSVVVYPGGIRRPTDQHLSIGVLFQDNMPGLERFSVQMGLNYGSRLPYGPPSYNRYADTLTMKSYFRVDIGLSYDLLYNKKKTANKWYGKMQDAIVSFEVFNLLGINNVLSKQWVQDVSGKYYSIPNYLTQRRFNLKLIVRI